MKCIIDSVVWCVAHFFLSFFWKTCCQSFMLVFVMYFYFLLALFPLLRIQYSLVDISIYFTMQYAMFYIVLKCRCTYVIHTKCIHANTILHLKIGRRNACISIHPYCINTKKSEAHNKYRTQMQRQMYMYHVPYMSSTGSRFMKEFREYFRQTF